jgi:hypothetical protein
MRYALLLILSLSFCSSAIGRKQWITAGISEYSQFHTDQRQNDSLLQYTNKAIRLLPVAGYYTTIGANWGIGCEVGYSKYTSGYANRVDNENNEIDLTTVDESYKTLYIAPSAFEIFEFKKYKLTTSVSIPIQYLTDHTQFQSWDARYKNTNTSYDFREDHTSFPKQLIIGAFCGASLQRQIYKGLYCGPYLGFGFTYSATFGNQSESSREIFNGVEHSLNIETKNKNTNSSRFDIRPSFSINYFF